MQEKVNVGLIVLWPLVCCIFYLKFNNVKATFLSVVGGLLFLPVGIGLDLPLIPMIDKYTASYIGVVLGMLLIKKERFQFLGINSKIRILIAFLIFIPILNFVFNTNPIFDGEIWKKGMTFYDAVTGSIKVYIDVFPLIIGMNIFKNEESFIAFFKMLITSLVIYMPLVLFEVRMSPQLHNFVYGYFPHAFEQQVRGDGFRAVVFIGHGLLTANLYLVGVISLMILMKLKQYIIDIKVSYSILAVFIFTLILLKSMSALFLFFLSLFILYLPNNLRKLSLRLIVLFVLIYPLLYYFQWVTASGLGDSLAGVIPDERLQSFLYRIRNDERVINFLEGKFLIGNGMFGRGRLFDSILDGTWIIVVSTFGYLSWIILVTVGSSYLFSGKLVSSNYYKFVGIFAVLPIVIMIDQLVNSSWSMPVTLLISGQLIALSELFKYKLLTLNNVSS